MHNGGTMDTGYKNFVCTICYDIFLYPVCLPCKHRFCKLCLDKHLENNTMSCPICRFRVSNWLRQLRRSNADIVDKPFWDTVQKLYPGEVKKRINGHVDYETPTTSCDTPRRKLAKQGEIHQEYEQFLQKELEEKRLKDEENFRLSEAMIRMIEEEERREEEERNQQLLKDQELARRLEEEGITDNEKERQEEEERKKQLLKDQELARRLDEKGITDNLQDMCSPSASSGCCTPIHHPHTPTFLDTPSTSKEIHQYPLSPICLSTSTPSTSKGAHNRCSQSPVRLDSQSTSKENVFAKFWTSKPSSSRSSNKKSSTQQTISPDSKTSSISNKELSHFAPVQPGPSNVANGPKNKKKDVVPPSSRCSSGCDSIGQELNHFKPIRSSPTTPPKDGSKGPVPKVVVAQRGVVVPDLGILPLSPLDLLAADVSLDELETSINLEKQLEEDRKLAMEIQNQLNNEEIKMPAKADYNLRKRKRPSGSMKKKVLLDRSQTTLDNLLIK